MLGYVRILLVLFAFLFLSNTPVYFIVFYIISASLDCIDGYTARKFHQTSKFGAWFDVIIDLFSRGLLWCSLSHVRYVRILLVLFAFLFLSNTPVYFIVFYIISASLDCIDGYTARKFHQTSKFGAWFDVIIDLFSRGLLWCYLSHWGYLIIMVEWMTFVSTHSNRGPNWKETTKDFPFIVQKVMSNGFHSPLGSITIAGLHVLPIWLYGLQENLLYFIPIYLQYFILLILIIGRLLCLRVELFYNEKYIKYLLDEERPETNGNYKSRND
ncbi:hypothetical protein LOTGIDRAFT_174290 [Lottia gigantea]|uniref:CDP-alcohol phosphatidyltransferase n=1 Tax=Lottia gigantea TaxID=225164 RepID=V4C8T2_LOTGI|nr:hypothetical protein LOTGIDRAFT_174290 [Lottia gigantea]ESO98159.1 hypothetical protein LOTGIDRAFT_174290 [Lottia gigantea]